MEEYTVTFQNEFRNLFSEVCQGIEDIPFFEMIDTIDTVQTRNRVLEHYADYHIGDNPYPRYYKHVITRKDGIISDNITLTDYLGAFMGVYTYYVRMATIMSKMPLATFAHISSEQQEDSQGITKISTTLYIEVWVGDPELETEDVSNYRAQQQEIFSTNIMYNTMMQNINTTDMNDGIIPQEPQENPFDNISEDNVTTHTYHSSIFGAPSIQLFF
jgi:hypothetical protein